jgi:hypothetical protein
MPRIRVGARIPGILSAVKVARALLAVVLTSAACASLSSPPIEQRTIVGPRAEELWIHRVFAANGRPPTFDERQQWESQLDLAIGRYLATDEAFANSPQLSTFRFLHQVAVGMSKEQVQILLGPAQQATTDAADLERLAGKFWPEVRPHAREAWVYPMGWRLYFAESRLVDITQYQPR